MTPCKLARWYVNLWLDLLFGKPDDKTYVPTTIPLDPPYAKP